MGGDDQSDPTRDPFREEVVERAVKRYEGVLPPEAVDEMRRVLHETLATHPVGSTLLERARPRQAPDTSGDAETEQAKLRPPRPEDDEDTEGDLGG